MKIPEIKISIPLGGGAQSESGDPNGAPMGGEGVNGVYTSGSPPENLDAGAPTQSETGLQEEPARQVPEELRVLALNPEDPIDMEYKEPILRQIATKASLKSEWNSLLGEFGFGEPGEPEVPQGGR